MEEGRLAYRVRTAEATDATAIYKWVAEWADLLELTVTHCVEDAEAGPILAALRNR